MGRKASARTFPGVLIALALAACHRSPYQTFSSEGLSGELPRAWYNVEGGGPIVLVLGPEEVREVPVSLSVTHSPPASREKVAADVEIDRRIYKDDRQFNALPIVEVQVAGTRGFLRTITKTGSPLNLHRTTPLPPSVKLKETVVEFSIGGKGYSLEYEAPEELYSKYEPEFKHLLQTLRVDISGSRR